MAKDYIRLDKLSIKKYHTGNNLYINIPGMSLDFEVEVFLQKIMKLLNDRLRSEASSWGAQSALAKKLGTSTGSVNRILSGLRGEKNPGTRLVLKLLIGLEVNISDILLMLPAYDKLSKENKLEIKVYLDNIQRILTSSKLH